MAQGTNQKQNACIVGYNSLAGQIKECNRDTLRRIPELMKACGYAIYPAKQTGAALPKEVPAQSETACAGNASPKSLRLTQGMYR